MEKNHNGRWTEAEHEIFLQGLQLYGKNWKKIEQMIRTRTGCQIRSHAQKFFLKYKGKGIDEGAQAEKERRKDSEENVVTCQKQSAEEKNEGFHENSSDISFLLLHLNKYNKGGQKNQDADREVFDFWGKYIETPVHKPNRKLSIDSFVSETEVYQEPQSESKSASKSNGFIPYQNNSSMSQEMMRNLKNSY